MNLSALPELLLAWAKAQGTALLQGAKGEQGSPFKVGAEYEGKVLDLLPTGRHLVQVAGQKLDMALPRGTQTGDSVRLTFINAAPRPTFLMQQSPVTPVQQVQLSNTAQQVNALLRLAQTSAPPAAPASAPPRTALAPGQAPAAAPVPAQQGAVLAAAVKATAMPMPSASAQASMPSQAMTPAGNPSGAVAAGMNPPSQSPPATRPIVANVVMLQAQGGAALTGTPALASANTALLGQAVDGLRAAVAAGTTLRPTVLADPAAPTANLIPVRLAQTVKESGLFYESHLARWSKGAYPFEELRNEPQAGLVRGAVPMAGLAELAGMPEEAARLAGRQLHMLEGGPFLWQGFAWPGQWMEWQIEERRGGEGEGQAEERPQSWQTELRLTLPRMGAVHARIDLRGREVRLNLEATDGATAQAMQAALPVLQRGLEAQGLHPARLVVTGGAA